MTTATSPPAPWVTWDDLFDALPDVLANAIAIRESRPNPDALTTSNGTVESVGVGTLQVQLDEDEPGVLSTVQGVESAGARVHVFHTPGGGAFCLGHTVAAPSTGGGPSSALALAYFPGELVPVEAAGPTQITAAAAIGSIRMSMESAPPTGLECTIDVYLNGVSLWADPLDRPTLTAGDAVGDFPLDAPVAVADGDVITFAVVNPAGRGLTVQAVAA